MAGDWIKMKLPSFQFYPGDWRKDPGVQALSFHDRGVWFEILCLLHESEDRGKLLLNGKSMPDDALARLLGLDKQVLTNALTTLLTYGVASRDESTGALMSRRMVRDEEIRKIRQECGKRGGNPRLLNQIGNQNTTTKDNQKLTPSSSSSSSSSEVQEASTSSASEKEESLKEPEPARPVEPPPFAPMLEQVQAFAKDNAISPECAEKWFWNHDAENWQDRFGKPLANWRSSLRGYWQTWAENDRRAIATQKPIQGRTTPKPERKTPRPAQPAQPSTLFPDGPPPGVTLNQW